MQGGGQAVLDRATDHRNLKRVRAHAPRHDQSGKAATGTSITSSGGALDGKPCARHVARCARQSGAGRTSKAVNSGRTCCGRLRCVMRLDDHRQASGFVGWDRCRRNSAARRRRALFAHLTGQYGAGTRSRAWQHIWRRSMNLSACTSRLARWGYCSRRRRRAFAPGSARKCGIDVLRPIGVRRRSPAAAVHPPFMESIVACRACRTAFEDNPVGAVRA